MADVAQLVRALVCGTGGRGFKPHHSPQAKTPSLPRVFCLEGSRKLLPGSFDFGTNRVEAIGKVFVPTIDRVDITEYRAAFGGKHGEHDDD